jgi:hypothetical protein
MVIVSSLGLVTYNSAGALGAGWSVQLSLGKGDLTGISCPNARFCVAMDDIHALQTTDGGARWRAEPVATNYSIGAVSCSSTDDCHGIGDLGGNYWTFMSEVDGSRWVPDSHVLGDIGIITVSSLSCPSVRLCVSVGGFGMGGNSNHYSIWTSNNVPTSHAGQSSWNKSSITFPNMSVTDTLASVSCPTSTVCYAISNVIDEGTAVLKSTDSARTWARVALAPGSDVTTKLLRSSYFDAISCPTSASCTIVGSGGPHLLVIRTDDGGAQWRWTFGPPDPLLAEAGWSPDVSCADAATCVIADGRRALRTTNSGVTWKTSLIPRGYLQSLSCPTARRCFATSVGGRVKGHELVTTGAENLLVFNAPPP